MQNQATDQKQNGYSYGYGSDIFLPYYVDVDSNEESKEKIKRIIMAAKKKKTP
jgi:hypothetical protein